MYCMWKNKQEIISNEFVLSFMGLELVHRSMKYYHGWQMFSVKGQAILFLPLSAKTIHLCCSTKVTVDKIQTNEHAVLQ